MTPYRHTYVKYLIDIQKYINQLRMLRNDLAEDTIIIEIQKIAAQSPVRVITVLREAVERAMAGEPMEWETNEVDMIKNTLLKATCAVEVFHEQINRADSVFQEAAEALKSIKKIKNKNVTRRKFKDIQRIP